MLNEGKKIVEPKTEEELMPKVYDKEEDFGFIPPGLSDEMKQVLINA